MLEKWESPTLDELTDAESRADRPDIYLINGVPGSDA
jgi:hypothetical protein